MEPREHLSMLLDWHDGDDRCGCLAGLVSRLVDGHGNTEAAVEVLRHCLAEHPAGITMRASMSRSTSHGSSHG